MQERRGPVGARPEEGHRNGARDGTPPYEDRLRAGAVQPGEEKAAGRAESGLSVSKGAVRRKGTDSLVDLSDWTRGNDFRQKEEIFRLDIRKKILQKGR